MCFQGISASPRAGTSVQNTPQIVYLEDGGRVGKALSICSSPPFVEDFPESINSPILLGVLALGVWVKGPPAASEQALSRKWKAFWDTGGARGTTLHSCSTEIRGRLSCDAGIKCICL